MTCEKNKMRRVRSFVRRDGRMTEGQEHALEKLWPQFGLSLENKCADFDVVFQRKAPRILEIGFGAGISLLAMAQAHPEQDFIGIETHKPGVGALLMAMEAQHVTN